MTRYCERAFSAPQCPACTAPPVTRRTSPGDTLFYGQLGAGASFHVLSAMADRPDGVLVAGGVVAPLASAGYVLGTLGLARDVRPAYPRTSVILFAGWGGMFLVGIAYHAVYTTLGFAAKLPPADAAATLGRIRLLLSTLYAGEMVLGIAGTLALLAALVRGGTRHPRWLALLTPTVWAMLDGLPRALPSPVGAVVSGTWINGWFTLFFLATALAGWRRRSPAPSSMSEALSVGE